MNLNDNTKELKKTRFKINKIVIGGLILITAVIILIITSVKGSAQYYYSVEEVISGKTGMHTNLRVSGVVLGNTIQYDSGSFLLTFTIANIPDSNKAIEASGGLAQVLHDASLNPEAARLEVVYKGERPDLLNNEAQAIVTGSMGGDGRFYANEVLLKCPSRYEDSLPNQVEP